MLITMTPWFSSLEPQPSSGPLCCFVGVTDGSSLLLSDDAETTQKASEGLGCKAPAAPLHWEALHPPSCLLTVFHQSCVLGELPPVSFFHAVFPQDGQLRPGGL